MGPPFPSGLGAYPAGGIPGTVWVPIDRATLHACRDPRDYRPKEALGGLEPDGEPSCACLRRFLDVFFISVIGV